MLPVRICHLTCMGEVFIGFEVGMEDTTSSIASILTTLDSGFHIHIVSQMVSFI